METAVRIGRHTSTRDLVAVLFRQKWVILTVFAVATVSVFLFTLRTPTTYESTASLSIYRGRVESAQNPNLRVLSWEEEMASELETVSSYPVARLAQETLDRWHAEGELSQPIRLNRGGIAAGVRGESSVLDISYSSQDATVCRPVTDALCEAYTEFRREALRIPGVDQFFAGELERATTRLAELEAEKEAFLESIGSVGSPNASTFLSTMLTQRDFELMGIQRDLNVKRRQLAGLRALDPEENLSTAPFLHLGLGNENTLQDLNDQVSRLRVTLDQKAATMTENHPEYRAAADALAGVEAELRNEIASTIRLLEGEIEVLEASRREFAEAVAEVRADIAAVPTSQVRLSRLDSEIELIRQELRDLTYKQTASRVNQATSPNVTVTLLSPASSPYAKNTRDYVRLALAPLMSLVVGLLLAFFLDSLDRTLRSPGEVEEHLGLPVLAALPDSNR